MDPTLTVKLVAIALVLAAALLGGWIPLRFGLTEPGRRSLVLGNAFAGGVFLGAGLIHLLPDSTELLALHGAGADYPLTALIAALGFLFVLWTEHVVAARRHPRSEHRAGAAILLIVLGAHSLIAGIALGLEQDVAATIALLVAVLAHKATAAFALGATLQQAGIRGVAYVRRLVVFSIATPAGIVIGSIVGEALTGGAAQLAEGIFDAVAAGTFLYIATIEITAEVFSVKEQRLAKATFATGGLLLMGIVAIWT